MWIGMGLKLVFCGWRCGGVAYEGKWRGEGCSPPVDIFLYCGFLRYHYCSYEIKRKLG